MKKIITLALISSLFIASIPADDFVSMLKQKLEEFNKNNPADRAILVFNQKKYAVADTAFFQTYLFNEEMIGVKGKKILSLTVYDTNGKAIQRINFSVTNGKANNQLAISPTTPPGVYLFSVNYAQNSDEESGILFAKEIAIVEKNTIALAAPSTAPQLSVSYESGFVNSIENTLLLQCNQPGSGKIKNSKNEDIVSFTLVKNKISTLSFIPQRGETYYAEMESLGIKTPLVAAKNDGYVIRLAESTNAPTRKITILSSFNDSQKNEIYLVVTNRRKITFSTPVFFDSKGFFEANLPKDVTKNGISFATLFDEKGNVLAERPFFKQEPSLVASLTPTAIDAGTRKKVSLELTVKDLFGNALQGDFSVSAFQKDLFKEELANSFSNEVTLPYPISLQLAMQPMAGETNQERNNQTDYLIASDQSIAMPWSSILNSVSKPSKVVSSSLKLKGKIIFKESGKPVPDSTLIMGYLQNNMIGYVGYTSKDGRFELPFLYDFFGDDQLFYLLEQNGKEMTEPFQMIPDEGKLSVRPTNRYIIKDSIDQYAEYILKKRIVEKSYNFYAPKNVTQSEIDDLNARFEEEAMGVDMSVNVQDYISFPTMEDLVREVIPFLQNKKKGAVSSVRLLINQNKRNTNYVTAKGEPLFIIDGILTKNIQSFLNLKPVDILTIKIINDINKLNRLGPLGKNGVVLIKTKKPDESNIINNSTIINVQGLNKPKEYYNPTYSSANNATIPDIRSFLYWNPIQSLSQSGKATIEFYTSDKVGSYTVLVRGISSIGEPFEVSCKLNIYYQFFQ